MKLFRSLGFLLALGFLTLILVVSIPISARSSTPKMQTVAVINDRNPIDRGLNAREKNYSDREFITKNCISIVWEIYYHWVT